MRSGSTLCLTGLLTSPQLLTRDRAPRDCCVSGPRIVRWHLSDDRPERTGSAGHAVVPGLHPKTVNKDLKRHACVRAARSVPGEGGPVRGLGWPVRRMGYSFWSVDRLHTSGKAGSRVPGAANAEPRNREPTTLLLVKVLPYGRMDIIIHLLRYLSTAI